MSSLTLWAFDDADHAQLALERLRAASKLGLVDPLEAAVVTWPPERTRPQTRQLSGSSGTGAVSDVFWGMLFGLTFFAPALGHSTGAGAGSGQLVDLGIDDDFIATARDCLEPGCSELFMITEHVVIDKVHGIFAGMPVELVQTNLGAEQEAALRDLFEPALFD